MSRSLTRAARLREIENLLFHNAQGLRVVELAHACGVNRRTIYRDIDLLSDAGVPIWQDEGRYGIIRDQYVATVRLRFSEAVALYIAARLLARHADEHNPHIVAALNKVATAFPEPLAGYVASTAEAVRDRPVNEDFVRVLETITLCWAETHKVNIWYRSLRSDTLSQRVIAPYMIEPSSSGGLYVIGHDDRSGEIRTFKLERLERAQRLPDTYNIPASFDPASYLADAWGIMSGGEPVPVKLRFSSDVAPIIGERTWHPSQRLVTEPDGTVILDVQVSDPREMRPWIRSWGAEVEVLAPASLRADLAQEARRLADLYRIVDWS